MRTQLPLLSCFGIKNLQLGLYLNYYQEIQENKEIEQAGTPKLKKTAKKKKILEIVENSDSKLLDLSDELPHNSDIEDITPFDSNLVVAKNLVLVKCVIGKYGWEIFCVA